MKLKTLTPIISKMAFIFIGCLLTFGCQKEANTKEEPQSVSSPQENSLAQVMQAATADNAMSPYNLNVLLSGSGNNVGFVKFRQHPDTARIINLNTWLFNLKPNHSYLLQRAVNLITDSTQCSSTAWLTLGKGLEPQSIHTNRRGYGMEPLWRDITSAARGTELYIHFQVIDSVTSKVVLTSDCLQYTVR